VTLFYCLPGKAHNPKNSKDSRAIAVSFRFEFDILAGAGHGDPLFETEENMKRVFSFMDKYLK